MYLDTSVLAAYYLPEEKSGKVQALLSAGGEFSISQLTEVELVSAFSRRVRLRELSAEAAAKALRRWQAHLLDCSFDLLPVTAQDYAVAAEFLRSFDIPLRTLDALHLAICSVRKLDCLTGDRQFAAAARHFEVKCRLL